MSWRCDVCNEKEDEHAHCRCQRSFNAVEQRDEYKKALEEAKEWLVSGDSLSAYECIVEVLRK